MGLEVLPEIARGERPRVRRDVAHGGHGRDARDDHLAHRGMLRTIRRVCTRRSPGGPFRSPAACPAAAVGREDPSKADQVQQVQEIGRRVTEAEADPAAGRRELQPRERVDHLKVGGRAPRHVQLNDVSHGQGAETARR